MAKEIRQHLGIPQRAFEKLIAKLKDKTNALYWDLEKIGFLYETEGLGRGARSWFVMN